MPATTDPSDNPGGRHQKTRLETEIEEILERAERDNPLPPPTPIRPRPVTPRVEHVDRVRGATSAIRRWLIAVPLLVAFMFAIVAHMLSDVSPLLTRIAVDLAIISLFWPIFESFRERQASATGPTMWRGREIERPAPNAPSPWQHVRQWLRDRRLLP